jgi:hypothetical protein
MEIRAIPLADIRIGPRQRRLHPDTVQALATSMAQIGLLEPVVVTEALSLVAGWHRLAAAQALGWETIEARVLTGDDLDGELAEIDENVVRRQLTILEEAEQLLRRDELLRARGTRAPVGRPGKPAKISPLTTAKLAESVGLGARSLQYRHQIVRDLPRAIRDLLRATRTADSLNDLLALAKMGKEASLRREIVERLAAHPQVSLYEAERRVRYRYKPCKKCGETLDLQAHERKELHHCDQCGAHWPVDGQGMCPHCGWVLPGYVAFATATGDYLDAPEVLQGAAAAAPAPAAGPAPPVRPPPDPLDEPWEVPALHFAEFGVAYREHFAAAWRLIAHDPRMLRQTLPPGAAVELSRFAETAAAWLRQLTRSRG